jgi:hypothetical protein
MNEGTKACFFKIDDKKIFQSRTILLLHESVLLGRVVISLFPSIKLAHKCSGLIERIKERNVLIGKSVR